MAGYLGASPVPQTIQKKQSFTATASQTTFTTTGYTDGAFINVFLNGARLINGTDYTATNGSDIVLTTGASVDDVLDFETFNEFTLVGQELTTPTINNATLKSNVTLKNDTEQDSDGGRASKIIYQGEQSGGEISTLAEIEASHDGTADDQKGDLIFRTNDGSDGTSPTEALRITSQQRVGIGTNDPSSDVEIASSAGTLQLTDTDGTNQNTTIKQSGGTFFLQARDNTNNAAIVFAGNGGGVYDEHLRILPAGGITFNGDTAAANALSDYEEGTFTPTITCGGGTATLNTSEDLATYTKIGRMVMVQGRILIGSVSSPSSALIVSGLPFTVGNAGEGALPGAVSGSFYELGIAITGLINAEMHSQGILFRDHGSTTGAVVNMADHIKVGTRIGFTATYIIV